MRFTGCLVALVLAGCTKDNPDATCSMGTCNDPAFPYCDADGLISGTPGVCIAVSCTPGEINQCLGEDALSCNASGNGYEMTHCLDRCIATPSPHCSYVSPKYLPDVCDTAAAVDSIVCYGSGAFDPNLDSNCTGGVVVQAGGPELCVVRYRAIRLASGSTLRVDSKAGAAGRAVALVSDADLALDGILDASANGSINGAGGGRPSSGGPTTSMVGGGGAGGQTPGGSGATLTSTNGAMNGGAAAMNPGALAVLVGGASANQFLDGQGKDSGGGGGGGALALISCRGSVSITGTVAVNGGGGFAGGGLSLNGWGGGAGGNLVIEGLSISVSGSVFANGGGAGAGRRGDGSFGQAGENGKLSVSVSAAGGQPVNGEGYGGNGGIAGTIPSGGAAPTTSGAGAGGGGGSVGFLQTYTPEGIVPVFTNAQTSPQFQPNATVQTR